MAKTRLALRRPGETMGTRGPVAQKTPKRARRNTKATEKPKRPAAVDRLPHAKNGDPDVKDLVRWLYKHNPHLTHGDLALCEQWAEARLLRRAAYDEMLGKGTVDVEHTNVVTGEITTRPEPRGAGITTADRTHGGEVKRHPSIMTWRAAAETERALAVQLGIAPLPRSRLELPDLTKRSIQQQLDEPTQPAEHGARPVATDDDEDLETDL